MKRRAALAILLMAGLAACSGAPAPKAVATTVPVGAVTVTMAENASYGLMRQTQDPELAGAFASQLDKALEATILTPGSANTAEVVVEAITVQHGVSRTLAAAESRVSGTVILRDGAGQEIARVDDVSFANAAARNGSTVNGIPIGALISMASNAKGASAEDQVERLAKGFAGQVALLVRR